MPRTMARKMRARTAGQPRPTRLAVLLLLAQGVSSQAAAQPYVNYNGSRTRDQAAAVASWVDAAEFRSNWGLGAMNAQYAYAWGYSGKSIKLSSVDSGLLVTHQEFADARTRAVEALTVRGQYLNSGAQLDGSGTAWAAGQQFNVVGRHIPGINDKHGSHVSGTIAADRNGLGMMGVSFASDYYIANTLGKDATPGGPNLDYNYFLEAYGNVAKAGARVTNSSWGNAVRGDDLSSAASLVASYNRFRMPGTKTWIDAVMDVTRQYGVIQVFAAGNAGKPHPNPRASLPYFHQDLESNWLTVTAVTPTLTQRFNQCGVSRYWCIAAPGTNINSLDVTANDAYATSSGTSMAAPHITGALGLLMERYPTLANPEVRSILLTTARHLGDGPTDAPNVTFGWGIPDLQAAMNGPRQLLGTFNATLPSGANDTWSNPISDGAWRARQAEEAAEIQAWHRTGKPAMEARIAGGEDEAVVRGEMAITQARIDALSAKTEADYKGRLIKSGGGTLVLAGANTYHGATDVAGGRLQAGAAGSFSPDSAVTVQAGATLALSGFSQRIAAMRNAGTVALPGGDDSTGGTTLALSGPWVGEGGLLQLGKIGAGGDRLLLSGTAAAASGNTLVQIAQVPQLGLPTTGKGVQVVATENGAQVLGQAFSLAGGAIDGGPFRYRLNNDSGGSYLSSSSPQGQPYYRPQVPMLASMPAQMREAGLSMLGNLRLRVGADEPRTSQATVGGVGNLQAVDERHAWGRAISTGIDIRQRGSAAPRSEGRLTGFQAGSDVLALGPWRLGAYVGQLEGDASLGGSANGAAAQPVGSNDLRAQYAALYGTWRDPGGLYADAVLQAGYENYTLRPYQATRLAGKGESLLASLEVGRGFALGDSSWQVEPQLQLVYQRQDIDDAQIPVAAIEQDTDGSWLARAGVRLQGRFAVPGGATLEPYARVNVYHRFSGADTARYVAPGGTALVETPFGGTSTEAAVGFTLQMNGAVALYGEAGRAWANGGHNSQVSSSFDGSLGLRLQW